MEHATVKQSSPKVYDRVLKTAVPGIADTDEKFMLENGFYVNEPETVIIQSTNETGKFFTKITQKI